MGKIIFSKNCCWGNLSRNICSLLFVFLLQFAVLTAQSQTNKVTGTIKDSKGSPLSGVSVVLKGAKSGTTTDPEGRFVIEVPDQKAVLVFSLIGHANKEEVVGARKSIDIVLLESANSLDEVVVIGYGTQKKRDVTGAISSITAKAIEEKQP